MPMNLRDLSTKTVILFIQARLLEGMRFFINLLLQGEL